MDAQPSFEGLKLCFGVSAMVSGPTLIKELEMAAAVFDILILGSEWP